MYLRFYQARKTSGGSSRTPVSVNYEPVYDLHHTIEEAEKAVANSGGYVIKALDLNLKDNK